MTQVQDLQWTMVAQGHGPMGSMDHADCSRHDNMAGLRPSVQHERMVRHAACRHGPGRHDHMAANAWRAMAAHRDGPAMMTGLTMDGRPSDPWLASPPTFCGPRHLLAPQQNRHWPTMAGCSRWNGYGFICIFVLCKFPIAFCSSGYSRRIGSCHRQSLQAS